MICQFARKKNLPKKKHTRKTTTTNYAFAAVDHQSLSSRIFTKNTKQKSKYRYYTSSRQNRTKFKLRKVTSFWVYGKSCFLFFSYSPKCSRPDNVCKEFYIVHRAQWEIKAWHFLIWIKDSANDMDIENVQLTKRRYFVKSLPVNMQNLPVKFFLPEY